MRMIDQYSISTVPIEMLFGTTSLGVATAFLWSFEGKFFLVTNWHNLSGRNPFTGHHISSTAAEPDRIGIWYNVKGSLPNKKRVEMHVKDSANQPLWFVHPTEKEKVDVVALPLNPPMDIEPYPINSMQSLNLALQIGMDAFVLGYPFGIGVEGLPVWKRGSVASEPQIFSAQQRYFLLDTLSRPGMSGSPVIRRSWGTHSLDDGNISMGQKAATRLIGVYSGRLQSSDPLDAQLGIVWPIDLVDEIIKGKTRDC